MSEKRKGRVNKVWGERSRMSFVWVFCFCLLFFGEFERCVERIMDMMMVRIGKMRMNVVLMMITSILIVFGILG